jgi:hypothetical protein
MVLKEWSTSFRHMLGKFHRQGEKFALTVISDCYHYLSWDIRWERIDLVRGIDIWCWLYRTKVGGSSIKTVLECWRPFERETAIIWFQFKIIIIFNF